MRKFTANSMMMGMMCMFSMCMMCAQNVTRLVSYPPDKNVINTGLGKQSEFSKSGFC